MTTTRTIPRHRLPLLLGVSALALLGSVTLSLPSLADMGGGMGGSQGNSHDIDPDGGMRNECGEAGGCAEAGESFESTTADELGEDEDAAAPIVLPRPRSAGGGLSDGDSVTGTINDGGLGE